MAVFPEILTRWRWSWEALCGADEFKIWSPRTHDLGLCFEQLCLQIPGLTFLAVISAYYFGNQVGYVIRGNIQRHAITARCLIVALLSILPLIQIYIDINDTNSKILTISYFLSAVEGISWFIHLGYVLALRRRLGLSPRGPIIVSVIWTLTAVLTFISFRTHYLVYNRQLPTPSSIKLSFHFSIIKFVLQIFYAVTLIPGQGETTFLPTEYTRASESQSLLHNAYSGFLEERDPSYLGIAMEDSTWLANLLFYWVNPLMKKGAEGKVNIVDDLYDMPYFLNCNTLSLKLEKALIGNVDDIQKKILKVRISEIEPSTSTSSLLEDKRKKKYHVTLFRALHKCFAIQFYGIGIFKFVSDCAGFAGPMLLNLLVSFIENKSEDIGKGYAYAGGLLVTTLIVAFCNTHFNFLMAIVGLKIRAAVVTAIYRKTLSVSSSVLSSEFSSGEIINFMSTDTDRIVNSCPSFHSLWSIPFQIAVTLYLLYLQVGLAFLAGLAFSVVLIPINKIIANKIGELSTKLMERKDERVKIMTEILRGIRTIKLHVWEQHFIKNVTKIREDELKYLKGRKYLDAMCVYFWATTPVLISILTFGTYVLMGNDLTAATVFTSMALLNMLIGPLNAFPWVLNGVTEAWVSIKRIQRLLNLPDLDLEAYYDHSLSNPDYEIELNAASFSWTKALSVEEISKLHSSSKRTPKGKGKGKKTPFINELEKVEELDEGNTPIRFQLTDINLTVKRSEFVGVIGTVGCGKSSLLAAILAELNKIDGIISIADVEKGFAFVTQQPWLQRDTIRENILFGQVYDDMKYKRVVNACSLSEDLLLLPAGDSTSVGEGGITLSGGQKARVALARAVYQDKDVYLLDDILSAVDVKVAKHIFQHCLLGLLKNKTRILCTHHVQFLIHCDKVVVMEKGAIKQVGKPQEVLSSIDASLPIDLELDESLISVGSSTEDSIVTQETTDNDSILNEEFTEIGTVKFGVYTSYWKAIGHLLSISIIIAMVLMQTSRNMTDLWLSYWVSDSQSKNSSNSSLPPINSSRDHVILSLPGELFEMDNSVQHYMIIYGLFAALNSVFTLFRAFLFAYGGICAASKIHKLLLKSVMKSKVTFFDVTSMGRILNRFSSDTYTIDDSLPFILNILLAQFVGVIGSMVVTIYGLPWLCLIMLPIVPIYLWLQNHYRLTSRQLKRISSVTLSPIYSHFHETIQGLPTIRALRANHRFKRDNEEKVEANLKAQFASQAASQWLGLRLQFIGVAMVTGVGFIAVIQHQYDFADPGLVGLAITYSLSITNLLNGVVNAFTETEREMIAVERVNEYIEKIVPENSHFITDPPFAWPSQGVITFDNVILKYRESLSPSLKGVSFQTRPAEKVGVVGRTGAGKSSLVIALFRLVELYGGSITIDTVNIAHLSLQALRSRIFCIPQEPFLYSGTVRENLDPLEEFRDQELWSALTRVDLASLVRNFGGLDYVIASAGTNLSVGQRQLFCLARAILHNAKIICVDEATANVDQETDRKIQQTLRSAFRKSTVITIAHRIETIMDCDRVLVMKDGLVVEFDAPSKLMEDFSSHFYQLVNQE